MNADHLFRPFAKEFDLERGEMLDPESRIARTASDMRGYYADGPALERLIREAGDPLHYEVFETPLPEAEGNLMFCISKLQPGLVGDEYFMTKGHYHQVSGAAEIYLCLRGEGLMLMKTASGECVAEPMRRGRLVYVAPHWAHRSINAGEEPLISLCLYPAGAGHNYGDIEREGFPRRVVRSGSGPTLV